MLPTERVPLWAAFWLAAGYDGPALVELAGLHGDDAHEVRDLLPAALTDCGVTVPATDAAAATAAFVHLARLHIDGRVEAQWVVQQVADILARSGYSDGVTSLPLGRLYDLDDEWGAGWGRSTAQLSGVTREVCLEQLRAAAVELPGTARDCPER
jgi:hypothetical protein